LWRSGVREAEAKERSGKSRKDKEARETGQSRTIEPLLAGDRQTQKRVARAHNPLQRSAFEVSLS
jgi:hypothetical protein